MMLTEILSGVAVGTVTTAGMAVLTGTVKKCARQYLNRENDKSRSTGKSE